MTACPSRLVRRYASSGTESLRRLARTRNFSLIGRYRRPENPSMCSLTNGDSAWWAMNRSFIDRSISSSSMYPLMARLAMSAWI